MSKTVDKKPAAHVFERNEPIPMFSYTDSQEANKASLTAKMHQKTRRKKHGHKRNSK